MGGRGGEGRRGEGRGLHMGFKGVPGVTKEHWVSTTTI